MAEEVSENVYINTFLNKLEIKVLATISKDLRLFSLCCFRKGLPFASRKILSPTNC